MRRGRRPLVVLYRRLQGLPDAGRVYGEGEQRELAEYVVELAGGVEKGAPEAMLVLGMLAIDAGREELARWLQFPHGEPNRLLDDADRALLAAFGAFVARVRSARDAEISEAEKTELLAAVGSHGRIKLDVFLRHHAYDDRRVAELEKRAYRFLERARTDRRAPAILRTLPAFVPVGLGVALEETASASGRRLAAATAVGVVLAGVLAFLVWPRRVAPDDNATADAVFGIAGGRTVLGWRSGRWRILAADGTVELDAPAELRLPGFVEGGASGDLTGDGVPELVLFSSVPLEAMADPHGIFIFTRAGDGWRLLDRLATHEGTTDVAACRALATRLAAGAELTLELHRARQRCPSRIGAVAIFDRTLQVAQLHYGREYLTTSCTERGCRPLERVVAVDADVTSLARLGDRVALGTGCWNRFGASSYGVVVHERGRDTFTWTGGRTTVAGLDDRLVVFVGAPCEGTFQQAAVAAGADGPEVGLHQRTLAIAEVEPAGTLRFVDELHLDACCGEGSAIAIGRDHGRPAFVAIGYREGEASDTPHHLRVVELGRPLAGQPVREVAIPARGISLAAHDLDGDGRDEILVSADLGGTRAFTVAETLIARPF